MSLYIFELSFMAILLCIDTWMFFRFKHLSLKASTLFFVFWVLTAVAFFGIIYFNFSPLKGKEFLAGYVLEKILSLDNVFVFLIIFNFFGLTEDGRHRVLFWGIILAIILRAIFIFVGAEVISRFHFVMYIFGAFLLFTGFKLLFAKDGEGQDLRESKMVKLAEKIFRIEHNYKGENFALRKNGVIYFTPLFLAMIMVAFSDIIFALDSIPAIFGITLDPFIVLSTNFFALMGLKSMFSFVAHVISYFHYIKYALAIILVFIGTKMLIEKFYHVPVSYSPLFIFTSILLAILASIVKIRVESNKA